MMSMTVTEVRDRLNDRFRSLVGSRAGWNAIKHCATPCSGPTTCSIGDEQKLLNRCSVFAGGFELAGACAVAGSDDEFATMESA